MNLFDRAIETAPVLGVAGLVALFWLTVFGLTMAIQDHSTSTPADTVYVRHDGYTHCEVADSITQWRDDAPVIVMLACSPEAFDD